MPDSEFLSRPISREDSEVSSGMLVRLDCLEQSLEVSSPKTL